MTVRRPLVLLAAGLAALFVLVPAQGGTFPGTNGDIAFTCGSAICITSPDGSNEGQLIQSGPGAVANPSWSADGQKLAYENGSDIWTANADGTNKQLFRSGASDPSYAPDNDTIAFTDTATNHIWTKSSTTSTQVTSGTSTDLEPAFSPDGTKIAYASIASGDTVSHIWVVTVSPTIGTPVQLTTGANDEAPSWSPDGRTILFDSGSTGLLYTVPASGGAATQLGSGVAGYDASYSPDGTQISYIDAASNHLWVVDANGTNAHAVNSTLSSVSETDWGTATTTAGSGGGNGPTNLSYPTITYASGDSSPVVGHVLTAGVGSWSGSFPITYKYQWKRCDPSDPANGACYDISGAASSFYTPVQADYGFRIRVMVTATDSNGSTSQNSEVTAPTTAIAAQVTSTPQITPGGINQVDQVLTLTPGAWAGSTPITFTYSWRRCDPQGDPNTCVQIPGATSSSYTPTTADIGYALRVWIVGTNFVGSDTAVTNHTFPIVDKPHFAPSVVTAPTVSPTPAYGLPAAATIGTFAGDQPITTVLRWWRCDATGADCHIVPGATKATYTPGPKDIGYTLRTVVTATNAYGRLVAQSDPSEPIAAPPPHVKGKHIVATRHQMYLAGTRGDDVIVGNRRNDTILGNGGYDVIYGGRGNDVIHVPGPGNSRVYAGAGSDTIYAANGYRDVIDCGPGNDRVYADPFDLVSKDCEVVTIVPPGGTGTGSGTGTGTTSP